MAEILVADKIMNILGSKETMILVGWTQRFPLRDAISGYSDIVQETGVYISPKTPFDKDAGQMNKFLAEINQSLPFYGIVKEFRQYYLDKTLMLYHGEITFLAEEVGICYTAKTADWSFTDQSLINLAQSEGIAKPAQLSSVHTRHLYRQVIVRPCPDLASARDFLTFEIEAINQEKKSKIQKFFC